MIFTQNVNRLEYITRNGFDNTADEKKQLMNYFSQLERSADAQAARIAELEAALTNAAEALGEAQGEWASVSVAYCPEEIAPLKEAEAAALEVLDGDK